MPDDPKSFFLSPAISDYLVSHGTPPDEIQGRLIAETKTLGAVAGMQIAPEQGAFLTILTRLIGARQAVEVGTFTGYSALCIARGLPADGHLLCCDVNDEWTSIGRRYWSEAGLEERIELRLAPAADTLRALPGDTSFDLAFIDADKPNYGLYYDEILARLRPGGVVLVDNVLWHGEVVDASRSDANVDAIRDFNDRIAGDDRVEAVMLPISDGLTLIRKR
ncbi:MAG TPA: O-methyltransferase [Acidimicrobiales bacterium]